MWHVPEDDELVRSAKIEIAEILEKNMVYVEKALHIYDDYLFILKERQRVEQFLADQTKYKREDFTAEIARYENTMRKIRDTMPKELRMNMFMIDCSELNSRLCKECDDLIERILARALDFMIEQAQKTFGDVKQWNERFQQRASDSTQELVKSEKEFEDFKLFKKKELIEQYSDLIDWLCFLYENPRQKLYEEQTKYITNVQT